MKLPNAERAIVEREKIADYLLNSAHPDNGGKAQFFFSLGFRVEEWEVLRSAFVQLAGLTGISKHWNHHTGQSILWTVALKGQTARPIQQAHDSLRFLQR